MTIAALVSRWLSDADVLRRRGAIAQAEALAFCAAELEQVTTEEALEALTVAQAAAESGYSPSQIRRRFPGQARIARALLPKKGSRKLGPELLGRRTA